jgi:hypothetical protein
VAGGSVLGQRPAYAANQSVVSAGPLNLVEINDQLTCDIHHLDSGRSGWWQPPRTPGQ